MIPVAAREIVDLVTRILRVAGVDPGTAAMLADQVARCAAAGQPSIQAVLDAEAAGTIKQLGAPHQLAPEPRSDSSSVIHMPEHQLRALEHLASRFLVAESTLDQIADTPTVD